MSRSASWAVNYSLGLVNRCHWDAPRTLLALARNRKLIYTGKDEYRSRDLRFLGSIGLFDELVQWALVACPEDLDAYFGSSLQR